MTRAAGGRPQLACGGRPRVRKVHAPALTNVRVYGWRGACVCAGVGVQGALVCMCACASTAPATGRAHYGDMYACVHARMHACLRLDARVCGCVHGEHSPCAELASASRACTHARTCVCAWMHACVSLEHPPWEELTIWGKADWPPDELQRVDCRRRWTLPALVWRENGR